MKRRTLPGYYHELAERLGMTVGWIRENMTSDEVTSWIAYDRDNIPDSWQQTALLCATLVNSNPFRNSRQKAAQLVDFLPERYKKAARGGKPKKTAQERSMEVSDEIMRWGKAMAGRAFNNGKE